MKPIEIAANLFWVGAVDWGLRDFHGYATELGSTYNAFLLRGNKKTALIDTVKVELTDQLLKNIREIMDPAEIDIIVSNHAEMDHTGALPELMRVTQAEAIYCSKPGRKAIDAHFHGNEWNFVEVNDGDTLELGDKTLRFIPSKMLHWPDSMVSWLEQDKVLFSNDIFGQHFASSARFDDEVDQGELFLQNAKYYANIFWPTANAMKKFLAKLDEEQIKPAIIAPDHGLMWRKYIDAAMQDYQRWTSAENKAKAVIVYDSMWESTAKMARAIAHGMSGGSVEVLVHDLRKTHRSDVATDILEARVVLLGSPVFNAGILPGMADFISYLKGLKPKNKVGASFSSYGWAKTGVKQLDAALEDMKIEIVESGINVNYRPDTDAIAECEAMGKRFRKRILAGL